jgi:hypothetical protein
MTTKQLIKNSGYQKQFIAKKFKIKPSVLSVLLAYESILQDIRLFLTQEKSNLQDK